VKSDPPDVRPELLVEELLELEGARALGRSTRIERRLGEGLFERGDDPRRVVDRPPFICRTGIAV